LNSCICIYIICNAFLIIECSFNVIDLSIFIIYDVQYVASAYGSKTNQISIFANHKWITHILNALVFMFLGVHFKKMCNFVHLLLKLNIYVLSSRFLKIRYSKNDISSFFKKSFKDWNILFTCVWKYCYENG